MAVRGPVESDLPRCTDGAFGSLSGKKGTIG